MVAQKHRPLTLFGNRRSLLENVDDGKAVLHLQRHEHAWHERKVKIHVRFVAVTKVSGCIFRPLVRFGEQHAIWKFRLDVGAELTEVLMRLWQVLAARVFSFVKVGDSVKAKPINAQSEPEIADFLYGIVHCRVIKVQVWLMRIKAMPIIGFCDWVPCPVRCFEVFKNDSRILVFFRGITPHIEVFVGEIVAGDAGTSCGNSAPRLLKPWVLIGSVIDDQLRDDVQISLVRRIKECAEIIQRAEIWIDVEVIGNVVSVISQRRRIKGQEPNGGDAEFLKIIQFLD